MNRMEQVKLVTCVDVLRKMRQAVPYKTFVHIWKCSLCNEEVMECAKSSEVPFQDAYHECHDLKLDRGTLQYIGHVDTTDITETIKLNFLTFVTDQKKYINEISHKQCSNTASK